MDEQVTNTEQKPPSRMKRMSEAMNRRMIKGLKRLGVREDSKFALWIARLGFAGFMFFFIKGLVWIAIWVAAAFGLNELICN